MHLNAKDESLSTGGKLISPELEKKLKDIRTSHDSPQQHETKEKQELKERMRNIEFDEIDENTPVR